eukprot:scaffold36555_cov51-Attheya_sp.AAC.5
MFIRTNILVVLLYSVSSVATLALAFSSRHIAEPLYFGVPRRGRSQRHSTKIMSRAMSLNAAIARDSPSAQRNKQAIFTVLSRIVTEYLPSPSANPTTTTTHKGAPVLRVLEIAAGCGVHTLYFATEFTRMGMDVQWHPTDPDPESRDSIRAWILQSDPDDPDGKDSVTRPMIEQPTSLALDSSGIVPETAVDRTTNTSIPNDASMDLLTCINMIHISPWTATVGLMKTARAKLRPGGILYLYGPYKVGGIASESNLVVSVSFWKWTIVFLTCEESIYSFKLRIQPANQRTRPSHTEPFAVLNFDASLQSRNPSWGVRNLEDVICEAEQNGMTHMRTEEMPANNLSVVFQKKYK